MNADKIVVWGTIASFAFAIGFGVGGRKHEPLICPVAQGQQVVSTINSQGEQLCIYANSYGKAVRKVQLRRSI